MLESNRNGHASQKESVVVHVIDDDISLRESLSLLLPTVGLEVRAYTSVQEFLDTGMHDGPGCIVLDVRLPGISGLEFQSRRDGLGIHLPIVLITGHGDVPMSVRAMKAGAVDFLAKPFRDQDMVDAVMAAVERERKRRASQSAFAPIRKRYATLSRREQQVMSLVTAGKMNKHVAFDLGLSVITVKIYRGAVMQKMAARSFADLVRMADALSPSAALAVELIPRSESSQAIEEEGRQELAIADSHSLLFRSTRSIRDPTRTLNIITERRGTDCPGTERK